MLFPAFHGGSYEALSPIAMARRTINFYVEAIETPGAEFPAAMYPTPGWAEFGSVAQSPVRAVFYQNGRAFAVIGTRFYEVFANGTLTERGTVIQTGTAPATITANGEGGTELFITVDGNGYVYDLATDTLTSIAALNGIADFGGMLDGFFISLDAEASEIRISELFDGTTWNSLYFAQRDAAPDLWQSMLVSGAFIWLFGEETSETWYNAGRAPFPFAVDKSSVIPMGIGAPHSAADLGGQVIWLARSRDGGRQIVRASGGPPARISTFALETLLDDIAREAGETAITTAIGEGIQWLGHWFYLLTLPNAPDGGLSYLYDLTSGAWTQVGTWNAAQGRYDAWAPLFHMHAFGHHLVGSRTDGTIWRAVKPIQGDATAANGLLDTNGEPVRRVHRPPSLRLENQVVFFPRLELLLESGLGITGQSDDPQVQLQYSSDGGQTWASGGQVNAGSRAAGAQGEYLQRVYWTRLGSGRQRIFEWIFSDAIPWRLAGAYVDLVPGTERRGR